MAKQPPPPQQYDPPVAQLLTVGDARQLREWPDYPAQYGLTLAHVPDLIRMMQDEGLNWADSDSLEVWAPVHAWRALGQLRAETAIDAILDTFDIIDDADAGDWQHSEYPTVLAMIGPAAVPALQTYLADFRHGTWPRVTAAKALEKIGRQYPETREEIVAILAKQLAEYNRQDPTTNALLISSLVNLKAVEARNVMAAAFKANRVDLNVQGDWEEVQIQLGLLKKRITPRPEYGWTPPELIPFAKKVRESDFFARMWQNVGRNDPCPCGSGKKYKKCHGKPGAKRV